MNQSGIQQNGNVFVSTKEDSLMASLLSPSAAPGIMERGDLTDFEKRYLQLLLIAEVGASSAQAKLPKLDYSNMEILPPLGKGQESDMSKASRSGYIQQEFTVRLPRLISKFPFISNISSKMTALKKQYRMKKLLNRTPRMPKAVGAPSLKGTSRPVQVKVTTTAPRLAAPKAPKLVVPKMPPLPKPVKSPKMPRLPKFHRSLARLDNGSVVSVSSVQALLKGQINAR